MSCLNPRRNQWRFTFETLAHIPTLRLYLFSSGVNPSTDCLDLKADLQLAPSLLVVSWVDSEKSEEVSIRVPIPRVLIDPGCGAEVRSRDDHIEIKMNLVLPVDHPMVTNLRAVLGSDADLDRFQPLKLDSDLKSLSSGDVHLFCRACSMRLTRQPLSHFLEMPSVNWREVADNWFGSCCCSFGGISEKLVLQYIKTYDCAEGSCLLDSAAVIICKNDLEGYIFPQQNLDGTSENSDKVELETNSDVVDAVNGSCQNASDDAPGACALTCVDDKVGRKICDSESDLLEYASCGNHSCHATSSTDGCSIRGHDSVSIDSSHLAQLGLDERWNTITADPLGETHDSANLREPISQYKDRLSSVDHCHCCSDETKHVADVVTHAKTKQFSEDSGPDRIRKWLHDCSLGSGFMNRTPNLSNEVVWLDFQCKNCSSILGAYPSYKNRNEPVDGGIRLFKCYVSTNTPAGGPNDIFRKCTLEKVFATLLLEGASDDLSYRIVLRDLRTKSAILQIVLLNAESWSFTGYCLENATMEPLPEVDLHPVVKVLFADCRTVTEASSRIIKDWSSKTHTEDIYMTTHQVEELTKCLKSAEERLPPSCSYLQGMSLSSMER